MRCWGYGKACVGVNICLVGGGHGGHTRGIGRRKFVGFGFVVVRCRKERVLL